MRHAHIFFNPHSLSLFEAPESSKVFTTGTKASCILTSAGKQNRVARQGSFKRQLRPFCSLLFMYKLQIAFANIFFKIKSSFLSFLQAPGAWIKLMALMETRGGRGEGNISRPLQRHRPHPADPITQGKGPEKGMFIRSTSFSYTRKLWHNLLTVSGSPWMWFSDPQILRESKSICKILISTHTELVLSPEPGMVSPRNPKNRTKPPGKND